MSAVSADMLRVRRPVLQDDDDGQQLQPVTTDQQLTASQPVSSSDEHGEATDSEFVRGSDILVTKTKTRTNSIRFTKTVM